MTRTTTASENTEIGERYVPSSLDVGNYLLSFVAVHRDQRYHALKVANRRGEKKCEKKLRDIFADEGKERLRDQRLSRAERGEREKQRQATRAMEGARVDRDHFFLHCERGSERCFEEFEVIDNCVLKHVIEQALLKLCASCEGGP